MKHYLCWSERVNHSLDTQAVCLSDILHFDHIATCYDKVKLREEARRRPDELRKERRGHVRDLNLLFLRECRQSFRVQKRHLVQGDQGPAVG